MQANSGFSSPKGEKHVTVSELSAAFLDYAKANTDPAEYAHYRIAVLDFLEKLYGDGFPVDDFKPNCLKRVREEIIRSGRFCRRIVNRYVYGVDNLIYTPTNKTEMLLQTLLNSVTDYKSFVFTNVSHDTNDPDNKFIVVEIEPRKKAKGACSTCGGKRTIYDTANEPRWFEFVPLWNIPVWFAYKMRRVERPRRGVLA